MIEASAAESAPDRMKILVASDGDSASRRAARWAFDVLGADHEWYVCAAGDPDLVRTHPGAFTADLAAARSDMLERAKSRADERARSTAASLPLAEPQVIALSDGPPGPAVVEAATDIGADLIVVGRVDRNAVSRLLHPSVSRHIVEHAPMPVLVLTDPGS